MSETATNTELRSPAGTAANRSASEEALAGIFAEVLRRPSVETGDNFFDIGGDSLKAMEVIVRVGEVLQVELPLFAFFEDPTVSHLAAVVDELKGTVSAAPITRVPGRREFPLSYSQQMFWLLEQQNTGTGIYNTARIFRVHGTVDSEVLERSLNELRRRHEILQVRFVETNSGPVQIVDAGAPLKLAEEDLTALAGDAREIEAAKLALATVRQPFDLEKGPVVRARLVRLSGQESLLCMAMHHAVSDAFTGGMLSDDLGAIYDAFSRGDASPLPEPQLHFTDFAAWEQESTQASRLDQDLEYWASVLQGAPTSIDWPTDFAAPAKRDHKGRARTITVPKEVLGKLHSLAQSLGTTMFPVLSAALRILLHRWTGQADFLVGTLASNRSRSGTERMVGCFVNPLPLRNPVMAGQSVLDLLNREKSAVMDAFAHQDCPFSKIVERVNPERRNDNPLFQVALLLDNFPSIALNTASFRAEYLDIDLELALLDLRFRAMETEAGLQISCEYKSQLFTRETADALLAGYLKVLEQAAGDAAQLVASTDLPTSLARQARAARRRGQKALIAVAATFSAKPIADPLEFLLGELGMNYRVTTAPGQAAGAMLNSDALVRADGFRIALVRFEDWLGDRPAEMQNLQDRTDSFTTELSGLPDDGTPLIVCFCPSSKALQEKAGLLAGLERKIAEAVQAHPGIHVILNSELAALYPVDDYESNSGAPYSSDFFSALATMLVRRMWGISENRYQVIAVDCDQILWGGHCGVGRRVLVDEPRRHLQGALLEQRRLGKRLCLLSSSREADVWAEFANNPSMLLRPGDFAAAAFAVTDKRAGIEKLARDLDVEAGRIVCVLADAAESAQMEASCPEVLSLNVPEDAESIPAWLQHVWAFDGDSAGGESACFKQATTEMRRGQR